MTRPLTIELSATTDVSRSAAATWAVLADYGVDPAWRRGVATMDPSPPGPVSTTTTTREVLRVAGRTLVNEGEVTRVDPGRSFAWRTTRGAAAHGSRTVDPLGPDACRVHLELTVTPKPSERLLAPVLRRVLARGLERDVRRLATLVEGGTGERDEATTATVA